MEGAGERPENKCVTETNQEYYMLFFVPAL